MGNIFRTSEKHLKLTTREVLNQSLTFFQCKNYSTLKYLLQSYKSQILNNYDDFFTVAIHLEDGEEYLKFILELDKDKNDERLAMVHARFLRDIRGYDSKIILKTIKIICSHYGCNLFFPYIIEKHLTIVNGYDPNFRVNMYNILICIMNDRDENESIEIMSVLLNFGLPVNMRYKCDNGQTALHYASSHSFWNSTEFLLNHKADPDLSYQGKTARDIIIEGGQEEILLGMKKQYNYNAQITLDLFISLRNKDEDRFLKLLDSAHEIEPTYCEDDGWCTLLQEASIQGLLNSVKALLSYNTCANSTSILQDPPILLAAENGHIQIVYELVKYQIDEFGVKLFGAANANIKSDHGDTVLHLLIKTINHNEENIKLLIEIIEILDSRGELNLNNTNKNGETLFNLSTNYHNKKLFETMLRKGALLGIDRRTIEELNSDYLLDILDNSISSYITSKGYKTYLLNYDFLNLPLTNQQPEMLTFYKLILDEKHLKLLTHPIITSFLEFKWLRLYWIYFINLMLYSSFVLSLTIYVFALPEYNTFTRTLPAISWGFLLIREYLQMLMSPYDYITNFTNILYIIICVLTPVSLLNPYINLIHIMLILIIYGQFLNLLGKHPSVARYITMYIAVYKVNLLLLAISLPFILSFAVTFSILFIQIHEYNNAFSAFFETFIWATGELNLSVIKESEYPILSQIIVLIFVVSIETILMNLLHALAVHDTEELQRSAELVVIKAKIQLYARLEASCLGYPLQWYEGKWGDEIKNRYTLFDVSKKLKSFIRISVLPFSSENNNNILIIREDGKFINQNGSNSSWNIFPGNSLYRNIVSTITGVDIRKIYSSCHEYMLTLNKNNHQTNIYQEITQIKNQLNDIQNNLNKLLLKLDQK